MKKILIHLKDGDKALLEKYIQSGKKSAQSIKRAHLLLLLDEGKNGKVIKDLLKVGDTFILKIKNRYTAKGLDYTLADAPRSGQPKKYTQKHEADLVAIACSDAPDGRSRWTLELLTKEMKKKAGCDTINRETVRLTLKKMNVSLG